MDRVPWRFTLSALETAAAIVLASLACISAVNAQELTPGQIDVSRLGPQVGDTVPAFSLPDQSGRTWTRESIMGPAGAMLVFIRSAEW